MGLFFQAKMLSYFFNSFFKFLLLGFPSLHAPKEGRLFDHDVASAFLDFFQSVLSGYRIHMKGNKLDVEAFKRSQPGTIKQFLEHFEGSQMWACFINERYAFEFPLMYSAPWILVAQFTFLVRSVH